MLWLKMVRNDFGKRNSVTVMLSNRDKQKLEIMAEDDEMSLAEWLRGQVTLAYFVRYEQQVIGESLKPVNTTEE
jgi:hypothetical protein